MARALIRLICAAAAVAGGAGCYVQRGYDGPSRSRSDVARLESRSGQSLIVDGNAVSIHSESIDLLPGTHTLTARVTPSSFYSPGDKREERLMTFETEAGKDYLVKGTSTYSGCIWVVEAKSGQVVSFDPKGCGRTD